MLGMRFCSLSVPRISSAHMATTLHCHARALLAPQTWPTPYPNMAVDDTQVGLALFTYDAEPRMCSNCDS